MKHSMVFSVIFVLLPLKAAAFTDVPTNHPHYESISWAQQTGIVEGYSDGTFKPNNTINRAEFVKMFTLSVPDTIFKVNNYCSMSHVVPDVPVGAWYFPYVCTAISAGAMQGYPDGTFKPEQTINYAEAAAIIHRTFLVQEYCGDPLEADQECVLKQGEHWYSVAMSRMKEQNILPYTYIEPSNPVTRAQMVEMMQRIQRVQLLQMVDNIYMHGSEIASGSPHRCQPRLFDPSTTDYSLQETNGSPNLLYRTTGEPAYFFMINGWDTEGENILAAQAPITITTYAFGCASSFSMVAEIQRANKRQSLFTHIENYVTQESISDSKTHLYIRNNVQIDDEWQHQVKIVDLLNNTKKLLPKVRCTDAGGFWTGNILVTHSDYNLSSDQSSSYITDVCMWNTNGELLRSFRSRILDWNGANGYGLTSQVGTLPTDNSTIYMYTTDPNEGLESQCVVYLYNFVASSIKKVALPFNAITYDNCPELDFDFSTTTFSNSDFTYYEIDTLTP